MAAARIEYIDRLKGFLILLVIIGHFSYAHYSEPTVLYDVIYSFHMPLFMFLSGFVVSSINFSKLFQRLKKLLFPFFIVGTLYALYDTGDVVGWMFTADKKIYWYLLALSWCLMALCLLYAINNKIGNNKQWFMPVGYVAVIIISFLIYRFLPAKVGNLLSFYGFCTYFPFFGGGHFYRTNTKIQKFIDNNNVFTIALILYVPFQYMYMRSAINLLHGFSAICAIIVLIHLFKKEKADKLQFGYLGNGLSVLGVKTLDIYIYHVFVLNLLNLKFLNDWVIQTSNWLLEIVISFTISIVVAVTSIMIGEIIKTSTVLNAVVYGDFGKKRDK